MVLFSSNWPNRRSSRAVWFPEAGSPAVKHLNQLVQSNHQFGTTKQPTNIFHDTTTTLNWFYVDFSAGFSTIVKFSGAMPDGLVIEFSSQVRHAGPHQSH